MPASRYRTARSSSASGSQGPGARGAGLATSRPITRAARREWRPPAVSQWRAEDPRSRVRGSPRAIPWPSARPASVVGGPNSPPLCRLRRFASRFMTLGSAPAGIAPPMSHNLTRPGPRAQPSAPPQARGSSSPGRPLAGSHIHSGAMSWSSRCATCRSSGSRLESHTRITRTSEPFSR